MVTMTEHPILVDGVRLDTLAWGIEAQHYTLGAVRAGDIALPGVDGVVASTGDAREPGGLTLRMFILGTDDDGVVPADHDRVAMVRENLASLLHLFTRTHALVDVREVVNPRIAPAQGVWQADCKVVDAISTEVISGGLARLTVTLSIPGAYWRDSATQDWSLAGVAPGTYTVGTLNGSSAPVDDAVVLLEGPATSPRLIDYATGSWVRLNRSLLAGERWRIDSATWDTRTGSGSNTATGYGEGGFGEGPYGGGTAGTAEGGLGLGPVLYPENTTDRAGVTDTGGRNPRLLRLQPTLVAGVREVRLTLEAEGTTAATTLSVRARRAHL